MQLYRPLSETLPFCPAQQLRDFTHLPPQLKRATDLQKSECATQKHKCFPALLCSSSHPLLPISWSHKVSSEIQTVLLTFTLAKEFYSRIPTGKHLLLEQGNQPQFPLAVPDLAATHRHKPAVQATFPVSVCTSLGQSKMPKELWGSLEVDKLNMCCDLARAQTLMDAVWLHQLHNGPAHQLADEHHMDSCRDRIRQTKVQLRIPI